MGKCYNPGCSELSIFLEEYCWQHLPIELRDAYGKKLFVEANNRKYFENNNFKKIFLSDLHFPELMSFKNCNFVRATILRCSFTHADFRESNFSGACLKDCRFHFSDFRGPSTLLRFADLRESHFDSAILQNVDLTGSDLRDAIFINADMIGAKLRDTKLYSSRIINTRLRKESFCNFQPLEPRFIAVGDEYLRNMEPKPRGPCGKNGPDDIEGPKPLWARFVYTMLKNNFKSNGETEDVKWAYYKEQTMERKRLFRLWYCGDREADALAIEHWLQNERGTIYESRTKAFFKWIYECFRWTIAYGVNFNRVLLIALTTIILFSILFLFGGFEYSTSNDKNHFIKRNLTYTPSEFDGTVDDFFTSLYMSVVTFTTLGYGDAHPIGITRLFASIEAILGLIFMALLVAILARSLWTGQ